MARKATVPKEKGRGIVWMQGLACGACVAVAPAASALLAVLLAPAIAVALIDRAPGRPIARAVLLCGAAPCVGPSIAIWQTGASSGFAILTDPTVFGPAWAACAGGWLLSQLLPIGIRGILEAASLSQAARLRTEREKLAQAWGLEAR
jgi:hypothetical protein